MARATGLLTANVFRNIGLGAAGVRLVSVSMPIHLALQADELSKPMLHIAAGAHAETFPFWSQIRTFQKHLSPDVKACPAYSTRTDRSETTWPLFHRSPWSWARMAKDDATSTWQAN